MRFFLPGQRAKKAAARKFPDRARCWAGRASSARSPSVSSARDMSLAKSFGVTSKASGAVGVGLVFRVNGQHFATGFDAVNVAHRWKNCGRFWRQATRCGTEKGGDIGMF